MTYEPTKTIRFYPGSQLSDERKQDVLDFKVPLDEITFDDILFNTARAYTGTFYGLIAILEDKIGKEATQEVVREMGYRGGKRNIPAWLAAHGVEVGSPALMSEYQDFAHALRGPDHASAYSEYSDTVCRVTRDKCGWHTGRPEGMESYCKYSSDGFLRAYRESDSALETAEIRQCMSHGDETCEHVFTYPAPRAAGE
jgi:hypothetical protein